MSRVFEQVAYKEELEAENLRLRKEIFNVTANSVLAGERIEAPRLSMGTIEDHIEALKMANQSLEHRLVEAREEMRVFNAEQEAATKRMSGADLE